MNRSRTAAEVIVEGDILVTAVANHFAVGRVKADGITQDHHSSRQDLGDALVLACQLAGMEHRVFLCSKAGTSAFATVNCATIRSSH